MSRPSKVTKQSPQHNSSGHAKEVVKLKRIRGQLEGVERMIDEQRYCMDILQQVKAARSALQSLENSVLKTHLDGCVKAAFEVKNPIEAQKKIQEISNFLNR